MGAPFLYRGKADIIFVFEPSPVTVGFPALVLKRLPINPDNILDPGPLAGEPFSNGGDSIKENLVHGGAAGSNYL